MAQANVRIGKRVEWMIEHRDTDGDGMLSATEMGPKRPGNPLFGRMDANGDGVVSAEEFAAAQTHRRGPRMHAPVTQ
jgi:Ca2+-binding EF-hand superfamily protein